MRGAICYNIISVFSGTNIISRICHVMANNKITASFRLFSVISVLISAVISKLLHIAFLSAAADITVSDTLAAIAKYSSVLFGMVSVTLAVSATVYAHSYFGRKTALTTSFISLACLFSGKVLMFLYNILANELSAAQIFSGALSYLTEVLLDLLIIFTSLIVSMAFAKKRELSKKENADASYSPLRASCISLTVYTFLLVLDLTFMNVIPFLVKYDNYSAIEIKNIIGDYLFYLFHIPVFILLAYLCMLLLSKVTGRLKIKKHYQSKL